MELVHLPAVPAKAAETLSHTALSTVHLLVRRPDVVVLFNAANAPFIPPLRARRIPVAVHVDGLEWQRTKWGPGARRYYQQAEGLCVRWADALISDAAGIRQHYLATFGVDSELIAYGAPILERSTTVRLEALGLTSDGYHLAVARFERENNLHVIVDGFRRSHAKKPLVVVGSSPYASPYHRELLALAAGDDRIRFLGAVWDQQLLDEMYCHASSYIHGHSVGGTNPSLLRALGAGAPVVAWDVVFNREVAGDSAVCFVDPTSLAAAVEDVEAVPEKARQRGRDGQRRVAVHYRWDDVAERYEDLCRRLVSGPRRRAGPGIAEPERMAE